MKNSNSKLDLHVAIFAFPFGTHAAPLLNITKKLASNAPTLIFSFFNTSKSNTLIFSSSKKDQIQGNKQKLGNIRVYDVWDGVPQGYVSKGNPEEEIELFMAAAPTALKAAVAEAEAETGRRVSCMVGDAFLWFVGEMAQEKGVPWVATWPGPQYDLSVHLHTDLIRETIGVHGKLKTHNFFSFLCLNFSLFCGRGRNLFLLIITNQLFIYYFYYYYYYYLKN